MAGLAAAHRLHSAGIAVELQEADAQIGGRARQIALDGFRFDRAAEFYCSFYRETCALIRSLGLKSEVREIKGPGALLTGGKLLPMIAGPFSALSTPLLSIGTKLRLSKLSATLFNHFGQLDYADPAQLAVVDDMSVETYARETFGEEFLRFGVKPGLESLTLSPVADTSRALFLAQTMESTRARFYCLNGGMGRLAEKLAEGLMIRCEQPVSTLDALDADAVILAVPAPVAAKLVPLPWLSSTTYASAVKLNLGLDRRIRLRYPGVIPLDPADANLAGLQFLANKGTGQAPAGCDGLGVVFREGRGTIDELTEKALELLTRLPGVDSRPQVICRNLERLTIGVPQFPAGRYRELAAFDPALDGRVVLAGDYLASPSLEGAIRTGLQAANKVMEIHHQ